MRVLKSTSTVTHLLLDSKVDWNIDIKRVILVMFLLTAVKP